MRLGAMGHRGRSVAGPTLAPTKDGVRMRDEETGPWVWPTEPKLTTPSEREVWDRLRQQLPPGAFLLGNLRLSDRNKNHEVDALVLPTLAIVAPTLGAESVDIGERREALRPVMLRLTQPFNLSRHPATALPCATDGLPVSLQVVGKHARTGALLDLCAALAPIVSAAG